MRSRIRLPIVMVGVVALMATAIPAGAEHQNRPSTRNIHPMGHIVEQRNLLGGDININTDIAFWGKHAFQGTWRGGFTVRDISAPGNPRTIAEVTNCDGPQGDVVVWDNILVRTWDQPAGSAVPGPFEMFGAGNQCGDRTYPNGWEGIHIFDISDVRNPVLVGDVEFSLREGAENFGCGSHTATGVPDVANNRLVVYSSPSNPMEACSGFDVIEIPLDDPANPSYVRFASASPHVHCHDVGVILGDVMRAACAGGTGFAVWELDAADLTDPQLLYTKDVNEDIDDGGVVTIGHSAVFSRDGETIIFGHEPGGGVAPFCLETTPDSFKSAFFYEAETGELQGMWTIPRVQGPTENCTVHNYNVVPTRTGKDIMVGGHYLAGTWVVDFTNPANPRTVAWSDPPPAPVPDTPAGQAFGTSLCGAWSSYWYNGFIYETNICEGLNIFNLSGPEKAGAMRLPHLNPQTQEFSL